MEQPQAPPAPKVAANYGQLPPEAQAQMMGLLPAGPPQGPPVVQQPGPPQPNPAMGGPSPLEMGAPGAQLTPEMLQAMSSGVPMQ